MEAYGTKLVAKGGEVRVLYFSTRLEQRLPLRNLFITPSSSQVYEKFTDRDPAYCRCQSSESSSSSCLLLNDGRQLTQTSVLKDLRQAIAGFMWFVQLKKWWKFQILTLILKFLYDSLLSWPVRDRNCIRFSLTDDYIKNFLPTVFIFDGYGSKLMVGRFPIAVIDIRVVLTAGNRVHPALRKYVSLRKGAYGPHQLCHCSKP